MDSRIVKHITDLFLLIDNFEHKFGYVPCYPRNRITEDGLVELIDTLTNCIVSDRDNDFVEMISKDYKTYFGVDVDTSTNKEEKMRVILKSFLNNVDLYSLYKKGVDYKTISDIICMQIADFEIKRRFDVMIARG